MTTETFLSTSSAVANAMNQIYRKHLQAGKPAETLKASMRCTLCRGTLAYQVFTTGVVQGRCNSINCLDWTMT